MERGSETFPLSQHNEATQPHFLPPLSPLSFFSVPLSPHATAKRYSMVPMFHAASLLQSSVYSKCCLRTGSNLTLLLVANVWNRVDTVATDYGQSNSLYLTLHSSTMALLHATRLFITLPWLYHCLTYCKHYGLYFGTNLPTVCMEGWVSWLLSPIITPLGGACYNSVIMNNQRNTSL